MKSINFYYLIAVVGVIITTILSVLLIITGNREMISQTDMFIIWLLLVVLYVFIVERKEWGV